MRAILTLILLAAIVVVVLVMTDVINIRQTGGAELPAVAVQEGRMPEFDVDTADVQLGTERRQIDVPTVDVRSADERAANNGEIERDVPAPADTR